jgi:hypothetical protein
VGGAADLAARPTPDPAKVSAPIRALDRKAAVSQLSAAGNALTDALAHDRDEQYVRHVLSRLWPDFVSEYPGGITKAQVAAATLAGNPLRYSPEGRLNAETGTLLKQPRSFGPGEG